MLSTRFEPARTCPETPSRRGVDEAQITSPKIKENASKTGSRYALFPEKNTPVLTIIPIAPRSLCSTLGRVAATTAPRRFEGNAATAMCVPQSFATPPSNAITRPGVMDV